MVILEYVILDSVFPYTTNITMNKIKFILESLIIFSLSVVALLAFTLAITASVGLVTDYWFFEITERKLGYILVTILGWMVISGILASFRSSLDDEY